jgi:hypothetical protein
MDLSFSATKFWWFIFEPYCPHSVCNQVPFSKHGADLVNSGRCSHKGRRGHYDHVRGMIRILHLHGS